MWQQSKTKIGGDEFEDLMELFIYLDEIEKNLIFNILEEEKGKKG